MTDLINVCGTCKFFEEYHNGFCNKLETLTEPDDFCCRKYEEYKETEEPTGAKQNGTEKRKNDG